LPRDAAGGRELRAGGIMTDGIPSGSDGERSIELPYRAHLAGIFLAGLLMRVYFALRCNASPNYSDMAEYNRLAVEGGLSTVRPPLYPLFLRLIYGTFGDYNYRAVFIVQGVLGAIMILLMYRIVARMWSRFAGLIAAIICALYPAFIGYGLTTLTETVSLLWVALMMVAASSSLGDRSKALTQGAVAGIAMLTKPAMLYFVPGIFLTVRKKGLFLAVLAVIAVPWILGSAVRLDKVSPVSDSGALMFYRSYNPLATGRDDALVGNDTTTQLKYFKMGLDFIRHNKMLTLDIINHKILILLRPEWDGHVMRGYATSTVAIYALEYGFVIVMIIGLIGLARLYRKEHRAVVWPVASYLVLMLLFSAVKYRYRLLIEPLLIAYAAMLLGGPKETHEQPR
jgi:4-amino-4-deoxy-L-arabinose transferase-like glycosyltransferase